MKNSMKSMAEKALKSFLKHKKIGFTAALLTAFMITGGISLASAIPVTQAGAVIAEELKANVVELQGVVDSTQMDLLSKIELQRAEIEQLLAENEARLKELEMDELTILRKADYYSKPIYPSTQIFFNYGYEHGGKMKNRTAEYLGPTINAIEAEIQAGKIPSGASAQDLADYQAGKIDAKELAKRIAQATNGFTTTGTPHSISVELGVQITPLKPDVPVVNVTVPSIVVAAPATPVISAPSLTVPTPVLPSSVPTAPSVNVTVAVTAPAAVAPISITAPVAPNPSVPASKTLNVPTPPTPGVFEPLTITPPTAPSLPNIVLPPLPTPNTNVQSSGNSEQAYADNNGGNMSVIHGVSITAGTFNVSRPGEGGSVNTWTYNYTGYSGVNTASNQAGYGNGATYDAGSPLGTGVAGNIAGGGTWSNKSRGNTNSSGGQFGFLKSVDNGFTYNNGTIIYSRAYENAASMLRELVHFDVHYGSPGATVRTNLNTGSSAVSAAMATDVLAAYDYFDTSVTGGTRGSTGLRLLFVNSGRIIIEGGNTSLTNQYDHTANVKSGAINLGELTFQPYNDGSTTYKANSAAFVVSNDNSGGWHVMMNATQGRINIWNQSGFGYVTQSGQNNKEISVVNKGEFNLYGQDSVGIYTKTLPGAAALMMLDVTVPITIYGDKSVGMYIVATGATPTGKLAINIGSAGNGNKTFTSATTNGTAISNLNVNPSGSTTDIEGSVGILSNVALNLSETNINIFDKTDGNVGVAPLNNVAYTLGQGLIKLTGGQNNVGIYASTGNVTFTGGTGGTVTLQDGTNNVGIYANSGKTVSVTTATHSATGTGAAKNNILLVADGASSAITATNGITATGLTVNNPVDDSDGTVGTGGDNTNNSMAAFATNGGVININKSTKSGTPDIEVTGAQVHDESANALNKYRGLAMMASAGGKINAQNYNIKVTNGSVGVASIGSGSEIDLRGSTVYVNRGFGLYTDGQGKINLSGSTSRLELDGTAVGIILDLAVSPSLIDLSGGATINVKSNNVTVANLINVSTPLNLTTLNGNISTAMGGVTITADPGIDKYKVAAVDGATVNINKVLDKALGTGVTPADADSAFFYKRFLAQRSILNVNDNVKAVLTTAQAAEFDNKVSALEMSSSSKATSVSETQINVAAGKKVEAGWAAAGAGTGATGLFINYGELTNDGTIEIELANKNNEGVAIYAVNGSKAVNNGTITTDGEKAIGMYGSAYRQGDDGGGTIIALGKEFGAAAVGQGQTELTNNSGKTIEVKGKQSVGMYLWNNSTNDGTPAETVKASNAGTIKATGDDAVGMYGKGNGTAAQTEIGSTGTIEVGKNGMAFYLDSAVTVKNVGNLILGEDAIGLVLDPNSVLDPAATFGTVTTSTANGDKMLVAVVAPSLNTTAQTLKIGADASGTDKLTILYAQNRSNVVLDTTASPNKVGKEGVGVYVDNGGVTNKSTIELVAAGDKAVGMYTAANGTIVNDTAGVIQINKGDQLGMVAKGAAATATNNGQIDINANGATGIYVSDSGAIVNNNGTLNFNAQKSFGIVADNSATVNLGAGTYSLDNADENIYVFGQNGSTINLGGAVIIDGVAAADPKKSVGIYLKGATTTLDGQAALNDLTAQNAAVGVYANDGNTIKNIDIIAEDDKTVGAYFANGGILDTTTLTAKAASGNAVGAYVNSGTLNIATSLGITVGDSTPQFGTGVYLTNGANLSGSPVATITNGGTTMDVGIYYTKGTASAPVVNDLALTLGSKLVGLYADDGIELSQAAGKNITITGQGSVGVYVDKNSKFTNNGTLTLGNTTTDVNVGIYVGKGEATNAGPLTVSDTNATGLSVGLMAKGTAAGDTAKVTNTGTINAGGGASGMGIGLMVGGLDSSPALGKSEGYNSGTINVTNAGSIGVIVSGSDDSKFDGTGGTINVTGNGGSAVGIYLHKVPTGKVVATGTINLGDSDAVGIFADGATKIDYASPIVVTGSAGGVGLFVTDTTQISTDIDASGSTDTVAVFLNGAAASGVTFSGNKEIKTGSASAGNSAIGLLLDSITGGNYTLQGVKVSATGANSIAVAVTNGTYAEVKSDITADNGALGVYVNSGSTYDGMGGTLSVGLNAIGVFLGTGATGLVGVNGPININFTDPTAVAVFNNGGTLTLGSSITVTGSGTMAATMNGDLTNTGNLTVSNGAVALLGKYNDIGVSHLILNDVGATITATTGGIAMGALDGAGPPPVSTVDVENKGTLTVSGTTTGGAPAIGMYTDVARLINTSGTINVGTDAVGMYAKGSQQTVDIGTLTLTGANAIGLIAEGTVGAVTGTAINATVDETIGIYVINPNITASVNPGTVTLKEGSVGIAVSGAATDSISSLDGTYTVGDSNASKTSVGLYVSGGTVTLASGASFTAGQGGLGVAADGSAAVINNVDAANITVATNGVNIYINNGGTVAMSGSSGTLTANDTIGVMVGSAGGTITGLSNVSVLNGGVGVYFDTTASSLGSTTITVGNGVAGGSPKYSIGALYKNVSSAITLPTLNQTGTYSIGAVLEDSSASVSAINLASPGVAHQIGIMAKGTTSVLPSVSVGTITVYGEKSIGLYSDNADVTVTGNMTVGPDTAVGIVSSGDGNVSFTGSTVTVDDKSLGTVKTGSIALYKNGDNGTVTTGGTWTIGEGGYGLYVDSSATSTITANNGAAMTLGESAVGAFINGTVSFTNNGNIDVGKTYLGPSHADISDDQNSVGIYLAAGATGLNASGVTIKVDEGHSVGVYATDANTVFTNAGTINVTNGGVGMFVRNQAKAINTGTINVDGKDPGCDQVSVGMAAYDQATIENQGTINVTNGALGMLVGSSAKLINSGTIVIDSSSTGIKGAGATASDIAGVQNPSGSGTVYDDGAASQVIGDGAVKLVPPGDIVINGNYYTFNGTLKADKPLVLNGVVVDLTNFDPEEPLFSAPDVSGTVRLVPTFPAIENGYAWKVENFVGAMTGLATSKITVTTSPLFLAKVDDRDGSLIVAKDNYSSLVIGDQFKNLYDGLDSVLQTDPTGGQSASSMVLKGMNSYLEGIYQEEGEEAFFKETSRVLAETRGDIYATIQGRMQNVQRAFDASFQELVSSYNFTKDTDKYSVIYTQGSFRDDTVGIDDYDYRVQGLYYMKEYEGRNFGNKWGWSLGFAVSRFDFDDAPTFFDKSKEDIYSARAGVHFVKNFTDRDSLRWVSRLEVGYNRHEAVRSLELDRLYKNKGSYDSYQVTFDNKLEKTLIRTLSSKIDLYGALNLEYGKFQNFTEHAVGDSGLTLDVRGKDYFSIQPEIGVSGEKRFYIGKKFSTKLFGSLALAYEFGENYKGNRARIHDGTEGYYDLSEPEKEEFIGKATAGIAFEKANRYGVTFDVEARKHGNKESMDYRVNVRFNYKFMNDR
jgi:hypothetical protein